MGVEPDCCFYIQNYDRISGREIDLAIDPPPDLVVEVDINSPSNRRFAIYRDLGVPEIWKFSASSIRIYKLVLRGTQGMKFLLLAQQGNHRGMATT